MSGSSIPRQRPHAPPVTAHPRRRRRAAAATAATVAATKRAQSLEARRAKPRHAIAPPRWVTALPRWGVFALLAVFTVLPWLNAAPDALLVDDAGFPPQPASTLNLDEIVRYFREDAWASLRIVTGVYRPLALTLTRIESLLWDTSPRGYHATSIAVHVAVTLALFAFLSGVLRKGLPDKTPPYLADGAAWLAALAFGVHPIHTEAVDSIFNRAEVLATLGVVCALGLVVREGERRPRLAWGGACVLYLLALFCKESAVTLPALLALTLVLTRGDAPLTRQRFAPLALLLLPLAIYAVLRTTALGYGAHAPPLLGGLATGDGPWARVELTVTALRDALRMIVWPSPLRVSYDDYTAHGVLFALILHAALGWGCVALWRRAPGVGVGLAMFDIALLPTTRLISHLGVVVTLAERYVYLPSIGCALAFGAGLLALARRYGPRVYLAVAPPLYLLLAPLTWVRNETWHSEVDLWEHEVAVAPENADGWKWLTAAYMNQGRWADILRICDTQLPTHRDNQGLAIHCAMAFDAVRRTGDAEAALRRADALGPNSRVVLALARHFANLNQAAEAQAAYDRAIAIEPDVVRRHTMRAEMLLALHTDRREEALAEYQAALAIEPRYEAARAGLARLGQGP